MSQVFDLVGVRYEVAVDLIGAVIAHHAYVIGVERSKVVPDQDIIDSFERQQQDLRDQREDLSATDAEAVELAIRKFSPLARNLYAQ